MPTFETFAARFARCVSLFRDPAAKDEQKAEFRALLGLLQDVAVTLRVSAGRLEGNGTPAGGGGGGGGGAGGPRAAPRAPAAESLGTDGILRGESWKDIRSVPLKGVPLVTHDPPPPPPATALPGETPPPPAAEGSEELSLSIAPEDEPSAPAAQPAPAPGAEPPAPAAQRAPVVAGGSAPGAERARRTSAPSVAPPPAAAAPLAELDRNPGSAKVSEVLDGRRARS